MPVKRTVRKAKKLTPATAEPVVVKAVQKRIAKARNISPVVVEPIVVKPVVGESAVVEVPGTKIVDPMAVQPVVNEPAVEVVEDIHKMRRRVYPIVGILVLGLILVSLLAIIEAGKIARESLAPKAKTQKIVADTFVPLDTVAIPAGNGRSLELAKVGMPIDPSKFTVDFVAPEAKLTVKDGYNLALPLAQSWSADAKLVFIKSVGTATGEGKAVEWQVVFGSKIKKAGYEVVIFGDQVRSQKTIASKSFGHEVPRRWFDSSGAVISLRTMPQFSTAVISGINFFYNDDAKGWMYGLATSQGVTGIDVVN